jgi:hypothetical protein
MSPVKADSKYFPLYEFLRAQPDDRLSMSMEAIDRLIEAGLPGSAYKSRAFWSNRSQGALQAAAWMDAGYHVHSVDLDRAVVTFSRAKVTYRVDREGGEVLWCAPANGQRVGDGHLPSDPRSVHTPDPCRRKGGLSLSGRSRRINTPSLLTRHTEPCKMSMPDHGSGLGGALGRCRRGLGRPQRHSSSALPFSQFPTSF